MTLLVPEHRTKVSPLDELVHATHRGMAHWAGTGPPGTTCNDCGAFKRKRGLPEGWCMYKLPGSKKSRNDGDAFSGSTASCRHYSERGNALGK